MMSTMSAGTAFILAVMVIFNSFFDLDKVYYGRRLLSNDSTFTSVSN